jgi:hypothetical protein
MDDETYRNMLVESVRGWYLEYSAVAKSGAPDWQEKLAAVVNELWRVFSRCEGPVLRDMLQAIPPVLGGDVKRTLTHIALCRRSSSMLILLAEHGLLFTGYAELVGVLDGDDTVASRENWFQYRSLCEHSTGGWIRTLGDLGDDFSLLPVLEWRRGEDGTFTIVLQTNAQQSQALETYFNRQFM